jgi:hypothetical protein
VDPVWSASFLPISPTPGKFGRPVVELGDDKRRIFNGCSLLFLEIETEVPVQLLGDYIGTLKEEGLKTLNEHRIPAETRAGGSQAPIHRPRPIAGNPAVQVGAQEEGWQVVQGPPYRCSGRRKAHGR